METSNNPNFLQTQRDGFPDYSASAHHSKPDRTKFDGTRLFLLQRHQFQETH
jgi:hypothetical protein